MNFFAIFVLSVVDAFTVSGGNSCSENSACGASEYCGTMEMNSNGDVTTTNVCTGKDLFENSAKIIDSAIFRLLSFRATFLSQK